MTSIVVFQAILFVLAGIALILARNLALDIEATKAESDAARRAEASPGRA